jgi:hypothetical protein
MDDLTGKTAELRNVIDATPAPSEIEAMMRNNSARLQIFKDDPGALESLRAEIMARYDAHKNAELPGDGHQQVVLKGNLVQSLWADVEAIFTRHESRQQEINELTARMSRGRKMSM